jgi:hypothetical protein
MENKDFEKYLNEIKFDDKPDYQHRDKLEKKLHTSFVGQSRKEENAKRKFIIVNRIFKFAAAAAIIVIALIGLNQFGGSNVAWADVVKKFQSVSFFSVTFYLKESTSAEPVQIDVWMGSGGKARIKVKEQVLFAKNGRIISGFNYVKQEKIDNEQVDKQAESVIDMLGQLDSFSLDTVVQKMSNGILKEMTPLINPEAVISEDVVVFDLTTDLYPQWLRIWALRESKLPIRILAWNPENGQSQDVVLTYTKEQSASFFNPDEYQKVLTNSKNLLGDSQTNLAYALYKEPGGRNYVPADLYKKYHNNEDLRSVKEYLSDKELTEYYKAHPLEEGQMEFRKGQMKGGLTIGSIQGLENYKIWRIGTTVNYFARYYPSASSYGRMKFAGDFNDVFLQYDIIGRGDIPTQKYVAETLSRVGIEIVESEGTCTVWIAEYNGQKLKNPHSIKIPYPNAPAGVPGSAAALGWSFNIKTLLNNLAQQQNIVVEDKTGIDVETELTWEVPNFKTQVGTDLAKNWFKDNFGITFKIEQRRMKVWVVRKKAK